MNRRTFSLLVAAALLAIPFLPIHAEDTKLQGEYYWDQGSTGGDVEAVFTPEGDDKWKVSFYFTFRDEDHVYSGTAEGSLSNGALAGEVKTEDQQATFTFEGTMTDGKFEGTHARQREGEEIRTGTLTMGQ